ncbi:GRAM-domain-containing protein [Backusella circina FSU 941]|nr:GRAM-domain-containing protein [Backusella circina FSU 941]
MQENEQQTITHSRAPSPVPSAVLTDSSLPARKSSFSTEISAESVADRIKTRRESDATDLSSSKSNIVETHSFANEKRNQDFHTLFRSVPETERLIDDYGCALQKEILLQGRIYISEHHICFNANIFGWITNLVIAFGDIEDIEKRSTAIFIPNAILISTASSKHFFASFLSRDQAFDQMVELWKQERPVEIFHHADKNDSDDSGDEYDDESETDQDDIMQVEKISDDKKTHVLSTTSLPSLTDTNKDQSTPRIQTKEKTECECSTDHFPVTVMDTTYNATIETMYKLLYNSDFMENFLINIEKKVELGAWKEENEKQSRESTYIKYLGGTIGPKSTKCYLKEEILHLDFNDYVTQLTVTQTPDVPSGGSFNVKTKTCISYAAQGKVRVLVTVFVEFTKSSWLKSTIEKATIDGQQSYYKSLDATIRKHLEGGASKKPKHRRKKRNHHQRSKSTSIKKDTNISSKKGLLQLSSDLFQSILNTQLLPTSYLTIICMTFLLLTNCYIAIKMAGLNTQLNQMSFGSHQRNTLLNRRNYDIDDSLWQLLGRMDPKQQQAVNDDKDENLYYSRISKENLDKQMADLETMIKNAGRSMEHVTRVAQQQREKILHPDWVQY